MRHPIAIVLLTCERPRYTRRTLETLEAWNPGLQERFVLVHGDDASTTTENETLADRFGFLTLVKTRARLGSNELRARTVAKAAKLAPWILVLENDITSIRTFPWRLFERVRDDKKIDCVRLYGAYKGARRSDPCLTHNKWTGNEVTWKRLEGWPEAVEIGVTHWSPQPSITRSPLLVRIHQGERPRFRTVRVVENVMIHEGEERTR
jgi:hypothetical protein